MGQKFDKAVNPFHANNFLGENGIVDQGLKSVDCALGKPIAGLKNDAANKRTEEESKFIPSPNLPFIHQGGCGQILGYCEGIKYPGNKCTLIYNPLGEGRCSGCSNNNVFEISHIHG